MTTLVAEANREEPEGQHILVALNETGDSRIIWDPDNSNEVSAAKEMFDSLKAKGFTAHKVNRKGEKGEVITAFDPEAEKLIMAPALRGG